MVFHARSVARISGQLPLGKGKVKLGGHAVLHVATALISIAEVPVIEHRASLVSRLPQFTSLGFPQVLINQLTQREG